MIFRDRPTNCYLRTHKWQMYKAAHKESWVSQTSGDLSFPFAHFRGAESLCAISADTASDYKACSGYKIPVRERILLTASPILLLSFDWCWRRRKMPTIMQDAFDRIESITTTPLSDKLESPITAPLVTTGMLSRDTSTPKSTVAYRHFVFPIH